MRNMKNLGIKYLISDSESAFASEASKKFYKAYGIEHVTAPRQYNGVYPDYMKKEQQRVKQSPLHGSIAILDRVVRTIRDLAYTMKIGIIMPNNMEDIVKQYNNAPHKGLSKWAGFPVSPQMATDDPELEEYIVQKIRQENYVVTHRPGFNIEAGTHVQVYNEKSEENKRRAVVQPGDFVVTGFEKGLYTVVGNVNGKKNINQKVPRYKLNPLPAFEKVRPVPSAFSKL